MPKVIEGTVNELIGKGLTINGKKISQPVMSIFCGFGLVQAIGKVKKQAGVAGGPAIIYRVQENEHIKIAAKGL